jgi:hypothetical protein
LLSSKKTRQLHLCCKTGGPRGGRAAEFLTGGGAAEFFTTGVPGVGFWRVDFGEDSEGGCADIPREGEPKT